MIFFPLRRQAPSQRLKNEKNEKNPKNMLIVNKEQVKKLTEEDKKGKMIIIDLSK